MKLLQIFQPIGRGGLMYKYLYGSVISLNHCNDIRSYATSSSLSHSAINHQKSARLPLHSPLQTLIGNALFIEVELDMAQRLGGNCVELEENIKKRCMTLNVSQLKERYKEFQKLHKRKLDLENQRIDNAEIMKLLVKEKKEVDKKERDDLIERGKRLKAELKEMDMPFRELEKKMLEATYYLPVNVHPNTPSSDEILIQEGITQGSSKTPCNHLNHSFKKKSIHLRDDVGRGAYYLTEDLVLHERHLLNKITSDLKSQQLKQFICPDIVKSFILNGTSDTEMPLQLGDRPSISNHKELRSKSTDTGSRSNKALRSDEVVDTQVLTGVGLQPFAAYLSYINVDKESLPLKLFSVGTSYGIKNPDSATDGRSLFDVNQSECADVFGAATDAQGSDEIFEEYQKIITTVYKNFNLPFKIVSVGAKNLKLMESRRLDFYLWSTGFSRYIKCGYLALHDTFISRRLTMKWDTDVKDFHNNNYLHTVYGRIATLSTVIACQVEHNQIQDVDAQ